MSKLLHTANDIVDTLWALRAEYPIVPVDTILGLAKELYCANEWEGSRLREHSNG